MVCNPVVPSADNGVTRSESRDPEDHETVGPGGADQRDRDSERRAEIPVRISSQFPAATRGPP
jgi:hypothetical protein